MFHSLPPPSKELLSEIHPNVLILQNNSLHFCSTVKSKYSKWLHELILEMPLKCKEKKCEVISRIALVCLKINLARVFLYA